MSATDEKNSEGWSIVECTISDRPITSFIRNELEPGQKKAVVAYMRTCRSHAKGPFWNAYKFKKLEGADDIWEMKPKGQVRLLGFIHPDRRKTFVLTNGFIKKQNKTPPGEISRAERMKVKFLRKTHGGE